MDCVCFNTLGINNRDFTVSEAEWQDESSLVNKNLKMHIFLIIFKPNTLNSKAVAVCIFTAVFPSPSDHK